MRRVALALFSTITGLVMLLSFKTHSSTAAGVPAAISTTGPGTAGSGTSGSGTAGSGTSGSGTSGSGTSSAGAATTAPSASSVPSSAISAAKTYTGDAVDTRFGPVQVQITVQNGTITAVNATEYPQNNPRDEQINAYAIPQLNQEATAAKSASIDMVSGATYTSEGYLSSLQSALDQAGL
jgi:uncharacterized protein with FMN-binding domain